MNLRDISSIIRGAFSKKLDDELEKNTQAKLNNYLALREANRSGNQAQAQQLASQGRQLYQQSEPLQASQKIRLAPTQAFAKVQQFNKNIGAEDASLKFTQPFFKYGDQANLALQTAASVPLQKMGVNFGPSQKLIDRVQSHGMLSQEGTIGKKELWNTARNTGNVALKLKGLLDPTSAARSMAGGAMIAPVFQAGKNLLEKKPIYTDVGKATVEGSITGFSNAGTTSLTNSLVEKLANYVPFLKPLTDKAIQSGLPKAGEPLKQALRQWGNTAGKRLIKAAILETIVETPIWAAINQDDKEKYIDALSREAVENLVMNVGMASVNSLVDAKSLAPIVKNSINTAVDNWKNNKINPTENIRLQDTQSTKGIDTPSSKTSLETTIGQPPSNSPLQTPSSLEPDIESTQKKIQSELKQTKTKSSKQIIPTVTESKIDPLLEEAKKYKTADEFIKAQGTPVYHGGTEIKEVGNMRSKWGAFYMTDNPTYAKSYGGNKSVLNKMVITKKAKLADLIKPSDDLIKQIDEIISPKATGETIKIKKPDGSFVEVPKTKGGLSNPVHSSADIIQGIKDGKAYYAEMPEVKEALKKLGYDGMITQESKFGVNYGVWNKKVIKTKSQLIDIWNQSQVKPQIDNKTIKLTTPETDNHQQGSIKLTSEPYYDTKGEVQFPVSKDDVNIIDKTFDEIQTDSDVAQFKADEDPQVFKNIFAKWIGKRDSARTKATVEAVKFKDVPGDPKQIIKAIEGGDVKVSPKQKKYITKLRQTYDRLFNEAKEAGIDMNYQKDYLTHIWEKPIDQVRAEYQTAKQKFGFSGERTIPTYEEGIKMGLKPKYSNPVEILSEYVRRLETTKANIELFKDLKEQGLIVSGSKVANDPNFTPVNAPGFPRAIFRIGNNKTVISNWYAPKNVANQINNIMTPQDNGRMGKIFKKTAKLSSTVQDITMSGGLPKTPLNAWTAAQATKEILSGRVVSPLTSFVRSLSGKSSNKFFQENAQQIIKMQERNIPVSTTFTVDNLIDSKTATKTFGEAIGSKWNKLMNEPTFRRFMPQLQINLFNDIEAGLLKAGKTETEAADIAAQAVKNFYGVKGSDKVAAGSKLWNDMVTTGLFAPKYRESMINFWVNNLKAVKKPFAPENITNTKFVIGAFLTYLGMNAINKANTGNDMADNPSGKEDKMLIKTKDGYIGVPFLSSIATMPRMGYMAGKQLVEGDVAGAVNTVAKGSTSSLIRPIADIMSNEDYYGSPIYDESSGKPWGDIGLYLAGKYNHPYIRETLNIVGQNLPENTKKQLGISKNPVPLYQTLSKGLELPFRFYNNNKGRDALATARYFDDKKLIEKSLSKEDKETWNLLKKKSGEQNILNSQQKALLLLNNPQLQQAEEAMAIQAMNRGETVDPIWELPPSWRKVVWASRVQLPGQKNTYDTLLSQQPWYKEFKEKQNQFYDSVGSSETNTGSLMPYPEPSAYVQQQMDAKNWKDPEVQAWFTARDQYYNQQLMALGLPPMSTDSGFSSRKGKSKRAITVKLSEPKKISITWKPMKRNLPTLKLAKAPTIKLAAPSRKYTIAA